MKKPGFDLEAAIVRWRDRLAWRESLADDDLDEMEQHLRDEVEAALRDGRDLRTAFFDAAAQFGDEDTLSRAFDLAQWRQSVLRRVAHAPAMVASHVRLTLRHLARHRAYALISILGLAIGLATVVLVTAYVQHEVSYEGVHEKRDRIYRVIRAAQGPGDVPDFHRGETSPALAAALRAGLPQVEQAALVAHGIAGRQPAVVDSTVHMMNVGFGDPGFFDIFSFRLLQGAFPSPDNPSGVVVSASAAKRLFGDDDPIGRVVTLPGSFRGGTWRVTGVVEDLGGPSLARFDLFTGIPASDAVRDALVSWRVRAWAETYVLLREGADPASVAASLTDLAVRQLPGDELARTTYQLQPLSRIRLHSTTDFGIHGRGTLGDIVHVRGAVTIALLTVLSACLNFVILATAQGADRAREIGARKSFGAARATLIRQFLVESVVITALALIAGLALAAALLPAFSDLVYPTFTGFSGTSWGHVQLEFDPQILPALVAVTLATGLLAGAWPAIALSRHQPAAVGRTPSGPGGADRLRRALMISQFGLAVAIAICTWSVHRQVRYLMDKDLGYDSEHVVGLMMLFPDTGLREQYEAIKQRLLQNPRITMASASDIVTGGRMYDVFPEGGGTLRMAHRSVDDEYLDMFDIALVEGRGFRTGDDPQAYLLNESAVRTLGWDDPVGRRFGAFELGLRPGTVVGVVEDFHFRDPRHPIGPMFLTKEPKTFLMIWLKLEPADLAETLAWIDGVQRQLLPGVEPERRFLDAVVEQSYYEIGRLRRALFLFAGMSVVIACLGVVGFSHYVAHRRTREIAVRRSLGASTAAIVRLLSRDVVRLVLVANLIAWPVSWWILRRWMESFAYRVELSPVSFIVCGSVVLVLATIAAAQQGLRASQAEPVDALRSL